MAAWCSRLATSLRVLTMLLHNARGDTCASWGLLLPAGQGLNVVVAEYVATAESCGLLLSVRLIESLYSHVSTRKSP